MVHAEFASQLPLPISLPPLCWSGLALAGSSNWNEHAPTRPLCMQIAEAIQTAREQVPADAQPVPPVPRGRAASNSAPARAIFEAAPVTGSPAGPSQSRSDAATQDDVSESPPASPSSAAGGTRQAARHSPPASPVAHASRQTPQSTRADAQPHSPPVPPKAVAAPTAPPSMQQDDSAGHDAVPRSTSLHAAERVPRAAEALSQDPSAAIEEVDFSSGGRRRRRVRVQSAAPLAGPAVPRSSQPAATAPHGGADSIVQSSTLPSDQPVQLEAERDGADTPAEAVAAVEMDIVLPAPGQVTRLPIADAAAVSAKSIAASF